MGVSEHPVTPVCLITNSSNTGGIPVCAAAILYWLQLMLSPGEQRRHHLGLDVVFSLGFKNGDYFGRIPINIVGGNPKL